MPSPRPALRWNQVRAYIREQETAFTKITLENERMAQSIRLAQQNATEADALKAEAAQLRARKIEIQSLRQEIHELGLRRAGDKTIWQNREENHSLRAASNSTGRPLASRTLKLPSAAISKDIVKDNASCKSFCSTLDAVLNPVPAIALAKFERKASALRSSCAFAIF